MELLKYISQPLQHLEHKTLIVLCIGCFNVALVTLVQLIVKIIDLHERRWFFKKYSNMPISKIKIVSKSLPK